MAKKRFGFTLAEVLITLGIIGVVASMTIPTLMQNIQNEEFKTKMRKEYAVLSQAHQLIKTETGGGFENSLTGCISGSYNICLKDVFKSKLSVIKDCDNDLTQSNECFSSVSNVKFLRGSSSGTTYFSYPTASLVLKDGSSVAFLLQSTTCRDPGTSYDNGCGWIRLDVNGLKGPNTWGKDIYVFYLFSDVIRPSIPNVTSPSTTDDCISNGNGWTCSSKYLTGN